MALVVVAVTLSYKLTLAVETVPAVVPVKFTLPELKLAMLPVVLVRLVILPVVMVALVNADIYPPEITTLAELKFTAFSELKAVALPKPPVLPMVPPLVTIAPMYMVLVNGLYTMFPLVNVAALPVDLSCNGTDKLALTLVDDNCWYMVTLAVLTVPAVVPVKFTLPLLKLVATAVVLVKLVMLPVVMVALVNAEM